MNRSNLCLIATLALLAACAPAAHAGVIAIPPAGPARVANADAVIVGKVESVEPQDVKVGTTTYRIAVVKIGSGIRGVKDEKTLRIAFLPLPKQDPMVFVSGPRPLQLEPGKEGLFILKKHAKENFYEIGGIVGYYINSDKNKDFDKDVAVAKATVSVIKNPESALKSKDAGERLLAAAILIEKHRTYRGPKSKQEPIDAEESKLILKALVDADWQAPDNFMSLRPGPVQLFQKLGVGKNDGFVVPPGGNYQAAAQAWVRDNAAKYRIQRFVAADAK